MSRPGQSAAILLRPCRSGYAVNGQNVNRLSRAFEADGEDAASLALCFEKPRSPVPDVLNDLRELTGTENHAVPLKKLTVEMPLGFRNSRSDPTRIEIESLIRHGWDRLL